MALSFLRRHTRILRDGSWAAGGQIATAVAALVSIRIITELLAPEEFGRLALLVGISGLAMGLSVTPTLQAVMRYYADWSRVGEVGTLRRVGGRLIASLVAITGTTVAVAWLAVGPLLGWNWFSGLLIAALLAVESVRAFEVALLGAARRQRDAALIYAADAWSRPLLAVAVVLLVGSSANAVLLGYLVGSTLVIAVIRIAGQLKGPPRRPVPASAETDARLVAAIRRYALPLAPLAVFGWLSGMGDRYVVGIMLGLDHIGLYAAAYGLASRPFLILASITELTMRPVLQNAISAGDARRIGRAKRAYLAVVIPGAACGVLGFAFLSGLVGDLLLAEAYRSATELMPWIALGYALSVISNVFSRFCYAFDDTRSVLALTVAGAAIGFAVLVPAIHFGGLWGAAAAVPARFGIELALSTLLARRAERTFLAGAAGRVVTQGGSQT